MTDPNPFHVGLDKTPANYAPLSPLSFLARAAHVHPEHVAVIHGDRRYSWAQTYARCRRLASALAQRGVGEGDTVSAMLFNTPEMFEAHYGVPMLGAVLHSINTRLDAKTIAYMLDHAETKVLLTDTEAAPTIKEALKTLDPDKLLLLGAFGAGCLVGLATFSPVLSWTFKNYHNPTLATLTGFMLGSLNKIWPWRKPVLGLNEAGELVDIENGMAVQKVIKEVNLTPGQFAIEVGDAHLFAALVAMVLGLAVVLLLERMGSAEGE